MVRVKPYWHDRKRPAEKRRLQVEIKFRWPEDKSLFRERSVAPVRTKDAALRWGRDREAALLAGGKAALEPAAPATVVALYKDFWKDTFIPIYCKAERLKPSGIESKWWAYNHYLRPIVGEKRLDEIGTEDIQRIKASLEKKSPKTVNNVLTVLSTSLKFASREGVRGQDGLGLIERAPRIRLQKTARPKMGFYENEDFHALAQAAGKIDTRTLVLVLLGGDAGLRRGEMIGLRWSDVDFRRRQITVRQSAWKDTMGVPKGGHERIVEMTAALHDALKRHQHLRSERVLCCDDGSPATPKMLRCWIGVAQRRANLLHIGAIHILRHTFCSRLAMAGAPRRGRSRRPRVTRTCRRRCGTCTWRRQRGGTRSGCWMGSGQHRLRGQPRARTARPRRLGYDGGMAAKRKGRAKAAKSTRPAAWKDTPLWKQIGDAGARVQELHFRERWHRKPSLSDAEWREGVNKQLDALTIAVENTLLLLMGSLQTSRDGINVNEKVFGVVTDLAKEVKDLTEELAELSQRTKHIKAPRKWTAGIDKATARMVNILKMIHTIQVIFGDFHKRLPPGL